MTEQITEAGNVFGSLFEKFMCTSRRRAQVVVVFLENVRILRDIRSRFFYSATVSEYDGHRK